MGVSEREEEEKEGGIVLGAATDNMAAGNSLPDLLGREGKLLLRPEGRHEPLAGDRVPCPLGDRRKKGRQTEKSCSIDRSRNDLKTKTVTWQRERERERQLQKIQGMTCRESTPNDFPETPAG